MALLCSPVRLCFLLVCLLLALPSLADAGPVEDAAAAFERKDYVKAMELWQALAAKGDVRAMNNVGTLYDGGLGVAENAVEAASWFRRAAEGGHTGGMSNYARLLEQGRGIPKNEAEAVYWFRQAADKGEVYAQYNLGLLYERGSGVAQSNRDAAAWFSMAASGQLPLAQARLGQFYRDGKGVSKNATRAVLLLYGAAMNGHAGAVEDLAAMAAAEHKGKAVPKVSIFGVEIGGAKGANRATMRKALAASKVPAVREEDAYICDVYNVRKAVPGATEMAVCYGPGPEQPLGFLKLDYAAPDKKQADAVRQMVASRFGAPSAGEGEDGALWNLGPVVVATQYVRDVKQVGLMYMVPKVYHLTRAEASATESQLPVAETVPAKKQRKKSK